VLRLRGEQGVGSREVRQVEGLQLRRGVGPGLAELRLHLGAAAKSPVDLDVAQLLLDSVAPAEPPRHEGEDQPDPGRDAADELRRRPELDVGQEVEPERADRHDQADRDQADGDPRQRAPRRLRPRLVGDLDLAGERRGQLADRGVEPAEPPTTCSSTGSGFDDGWRAWSPASSSDTVTAWR
jgi:hypothetical protein